MGPDNINNPLANRWRQAQTNSLDFLKGANASAASTVSAPVDLIAMLLNKAGANIKEPVGGSDWMKRKGLMEDPTTNAGYVGNALAGVLPMVAAAKAPQIANALNQAGANALAPRTLNPELGAVVYHGSPHKFDKFDSSKIGTGEGAQAYGHGLYLAQSPKVAKSYISAGLQQKDAAGSFYKVDLPDEKISSMLDWDKNLKNQTDTVRNIIDDLFMYPPEHLTGQELYTLAQNSNKGGASRASEIFRKAGITGIRYLDGGSRGVGKGTSNFVVFPGEEESLQILSRNGKKFK